MRVYVWAIVLLTANGLACAASAQSAAAEVADARDIAARAAALERTMKPGQGFAWQPVVRGGAAVAALEVWRKPGRPAVHPTQAEYATVVAGEGTLVSGGTLVEATTTRPGLVEGSRIDGGVTRALRAGDVLMIPAGMPHWFGIKGKRLVLLGTKIAEPAK